MVSPFPSNYFLINNKDDVEAAFSACKEKELHFVCSHKIKMEEKQGLFSLLDSQHIPRGSVHVYECMKPERIEDEGDYSQQEGEVDGRKGYQGRWEE